MKWIKEKDTKKNIIISLIASAIFLIFIQPIMLLIWDLLKKLSSSTFDGLLNSMYRNAALGQRNWIDFILLTAVLMIGLNFSVRVLLRQNSKVKDTIEDNELKSLPDEEEKKQLVAKKVELEIKISSNEKTLGLFYKLRWPLSILSVICGLQILFNSFTDLQLNTSFNQRVTALAPYINESEITLLKSKWALMKTRKNYLEINMHLDSLAKKAKIILPENLME